MGMNGISFSHYLVLSKKKSQSFISISNLLTLHSLGHIIMVEGHGLVKIIAQFGYNAGLLIAYLFI